MGIDIETDPPLVRLEPVSWETFELILRDIEAHRWLVTYDDGELEFRSADFKHERLKKLIGMFVGALTLELHIPSSAGGSTTYKRPDLKMAVEPDESYYIASEPLVRGNREADLFKEPPPDLVVEVDLCARSARRMRIFAAMGVPEVWRHDGERLAVYRLRAGGTYDEVARSEVLPAMPIEEATRLLSRWRDVDDTTSARAFLAHVRRAGKKNG